MTDWKEQAVERAARAECQALGIDPDQWDEINGERVHAWERVAVGTRAVLEELGFFELVEAAHDVASMTILTTSVAEMARKRRPLYSALSKAKGEQ